VKPLGVRRPRRGGLGVPFRGSTAVSRGRRAVSADTALRSPSYGMYAPFWLGATDLTCVTRGGDGRPTCGDTKLGARWP